MGRDDDWAQESGRSARNSHRIAIGVGAVLCLGAVGGVGFLMSGDKDTPRKIPEFTIVAIVPPPPPPPPPEKEPPPEPEMKQEIIEEKVEIPQEAPPDDAPADTPPDGPLKLDAEGTGPGELLAGKGGRGLIGGAGGGGGGGGGSRWGWYAGIVQSQIETALRANERTRNAVMQIQVRLWSDGTGRVNRVQLVSSTGDAGLDSVIRDEVLGRLVLREPPPRDMPMPIITRVTARRPS